MRVLVIGHGAREHALAWKLASEPGVAEVVCAPGNPGTATTATNAAAGRGDPPAFLRLAESHRIDLTVVGPELPLAGGIVDLFTSAGAPIVGPSRAAARLETSKAFAKDFMARHRVPTARYRICNSPAAAHAAVDELGLPVVVKADGLAAGKGVVVAHEREVAFAAVDGAMIARQFGEAGSSVVVEEFLEGQEASYFVLCDGERAFTLGSAQDHKRVGDGDQGPNTGGMGAFAPSPLVTPDVQVRIQTEVVDPVLAGLKEEGAPYRGFLYVGLMLTMRGPEVVEFNVRLGDPEAQVLLPLIDEPLLPLLRASATGHLDRRVCHVRREPHVGVVLASGGYPGSYETGRPITGVSDAAALGDVMVFHAGTALRDGQLVTAGGRVLTVVGRGSDFASAIARAYEAVDRIAFDGMHARRDIGRKALLG
jgi:phosphoribosylamine---glycine ligase